MKKLMGIVFSFFVMVLPVQGSQQQVFKNLDGQCQSGYCACVGCDQCSPTGASGCTDAGCLPNCEEILGPASLYSLSPLAQGAIFYCLGGASIQSVTEIPSNYANQNWYTCGPSKPFPSNGPAPQPLETAYGAYSFKEGDVFGCPVGESKTPVSGDWFTCSTPKEEGASGSSSATGKH